MAQTNAERQSEYKARKYAEGFRQIQIWVRRNPKTKKGAPDMGVFVRRLENMTESWSERKKSKLFTEILNSIELKKESEGKKKRAKPTGRG